MRTVVALLIIMLAGPGVVSAAMTPRQVVYGLALDLALQGGATQSCVSGSGDVRRAALQAAPLGYLTSIGYVVTGDTPLVLSFVDLRARQYALVPDRAWETSGANAWWRTYRTPMTPGIVYQVVVMPRDGGTNGVCFHLFIHRDA